MFLHQVKLTKNHWSYKLLHWTFPNLNRFYNFCPHFWLTLLSIFLLPFSLLLKIFIYVGSIIAIPMSIVVDKVSTFYENLMDKKYRKKLDRLTDEQCKQIAVYENYLRYACTERLDRSKLKEMKALHKLWRKYDGSYKRIDDYLSYDLDRYYNSLKKQYPVTEKKELKKQLWWPSAVKWTQRISWVLLIPFTVLVYYVEYYLALGIGWIIYWVVKGFTHLTLTDVIAGLIIIIGALLTFGTLILIVKVFIYLFSDSVFIKIGRVLEYIWKAIKKFFTFFWIMIVAFKENNCPEIIWTEDDK